MASGTTAAAMGLLRKGWAEAERVARRAETARLRAMTPAQGIEELLHLASIARALAAGDAAAPEEEPGHLRTLMAVSAILRRGSGCR